LKYSEPTSFDQVHGELLQEWESKGKQIIPAEIERETWNRVWESERVYNLARLSDSATEVVYHQCNITELEGLEAIISEIWADYGRIDLVIQGGGKLVEKSIDDFDSNDFLEGMRPKALGTACLLTALENYEIGAFINLSSIAGRLGNKGQSSYAAGHETAGLMVSAAANKREGKWINIAFGPWLNIGMTRVGPLMERLQGQERDFITAESGSQCLINEYLGGTSGTIIFCGDEPEAFEDMQKSAKWALLDRVEIISEGVAEAQKLFDPERDYFVAEHMIGRDEPVLPGVVGLEMLAQTAGVLVPSGLSLTEFKNVEFLRPGRFTRGECREFFARVQLETKDSSATWLTGQLFSLFELPGSDDLSEVVHLKCQLRFGQREAPPEPSLLVVESSLASRRVPAKPLWETKCLNRRVGVFQNLLSFRSVTRKGMVGEIFAPWTREFGEHPLTDNPLRLDGLALVTALPALLFENEVAHFMESIETLRFYGNDGPEEIRLCRARIRNYSESGHICDVEALDELGRVREKMIGLVKVSSLKCTTLAEPIWELVRENPRQADLKRLLSEQGRFSFAEVAISLVDSARREDEEGLIREYLSETEAKRYQRFTNSTRKLQWLAGRIVAKEAVLSYFHGKRTPLATIEVLTSSSNAPEVNLLKNDRDQTPQVSISHRDDLAIAVASDLDQVGVDVEVFSGDIVEIAAEFAHPREEAETMECLEWHRIKALTAIWAVKESGRKAIGADRIGMKQIEIIHSRKEQEYLVCDLSAPSGKRIRSVAFESGKYVYSVSYGLG
jgi:phosphopantetheinyl transferase